MLEIHPQEKQEQTVNIMSADDLATSGARVWAAMVLTLFFQDIRALAPDGLWRV